MKTYSEKLKDQRWYDFRLRAFEKHGYRCTICGEDSAPGCHHHVHHKRYVRGREPWQYSLDDVTILCRECHEELHEAEDLMRNRVRENPAWVAFHFACLANGLEGMDPHDVVTVLSKAKVHARSIKYNGNE